MNRWLIFILTFFTGWILLTVEVSGQNTNPFEIRSRLDSVRQLPAPSLPVEEEAISEVPDSALVESPVDSLELKEVNPFDVDHLPLRKNPTSISANQKDDSGEMNPSSSNTFLFWFLLLASALLAIVINLNFSYIKLLFRSIFNFNLFKLFHREEGGKLTTSQFLFYIIFFICVTTTIYLYLTEKSTIGGILVWSQILLGLSVFYLSKHAILIILGYIFDIQKPTSLYNFSIITYHSAATILLLPLSYVAAFSAESVSRPVLFISVFFILLTLMIKAIRGLFISLEFWSDRFFQFFMYLCAFEILPILVLVKFLWYQVNL